MPRVTDLAHSEFDGKLTVFKRAGSPFYNARVYVPGARKYVSKTTKTADLHQAIEFGRKLYMKISIKIDEGIPVIEMRVGRAVDLYMNECEMLVKRGAFSESVYSKNRKNVRNYVKPYFKDRALSSIAHSEEEAYFLWRLKNSKSGAEKMPAKSTIQGEITLINAVIEYAEGRGHIKRGFVPPLSAPKAVKAASHGKRAFFSARELETIFSGLVGWAADARTTKERTSREILQYLVPIMYYSGMRTNDIELLRWKDVKLYKKDGVDYVELYLRGKVNPNWIVAQPESHKFLLILKLLKDGCNDNDTVDGDDFVFWDCNKQFPLFEQSFRNFLKKNKFFADSDGNTRSLYSLRHSHAINRLEAGVPMDRLALNMRTSISMIEEHYGQVRNRAFSAVLTKRHE